MIKLFRATRPSRPRDKGRRRYILQIGARMFHLSPREFDTLRRAVHKAEIREVPLVHIRHDNQEGVKPGQTRAVCGHSITTSERILPGLYTPLVTCVPCLQGY